MFIPLYLSPRLGIPTLDFWDITLICIKDYIRFHFYEMN
jgi:hypothetical protein